MNFIFLTLNLLCANADAMIDDGGIEESASKSESTIPTKIHSHQEFSLDDTSLPVLVVDDNKVNRACVKALLKQIGFEKFLEAENGEDALAVMRSTSLRFVLMDIEMPKMKGTEATQKYRKQFPDSPLVIIANSTIGLTLEELTDYGFTTSVAKPYKKDQFKEVIIGLSKSAA